MCYKATTTVLATIDATDFIYTCGVHLADGGFATVIKDDEGEADKDEEAKVETQKPKHERYALHRDFFASKFGLGVKKRLLMNI